MYDLDHLPSFKETIISNFILIEIITKIIINDKKYFTRNVSLQCPHVTRHIPGMVGTGGVAGLGARLIILLQFGLGQAIR